VIALFIFRKELVSTSTVLLFKSGGLVQAMVVGVCPLLPTSLVASSVAGNIQEIGTLFKTQLLFWALFGVVANPMRDRALLSFFKSAKVHAPPDIEETLLRAADNGDEGREKVKGKGIMGAGPLFAVDWLVDPLLLLDVLMVTETCMSIVLSFRAEAVR